VFREAQLRAVPVFKRLPPAARKRVAKVARTLVLDPGTELVNEGEYALELYAIVKGRMDVSRGGDVVTELGPGDCFGEIGVLRQRGLKWGKRAASVTAVEQATVVAIPGHEMRRLVAEMPEIGAALLEAAQERGAPVPH
jgi:voltage-gated potassium channel